MLVLVDILKGIAFDALLSFVCKCSNIIDLEIYRPYIEKRIHNLYVRK